MNRRNFLRALGGAVVGAVAGAELAELLSPKPTIFLPPRGGWLSSRVKVLRNEAEVAEFFGADLAEQESANAFFVANAGVPQFLTNYIDPKILEELLRPMHGRLSAGYDASKPFILTGPFRV